ncbi:hypothetical protein H6F98_23435 [Microcoleus sp. FACHB-SPT15]|uniref:hypothetical protein n=1 Tax=Microcoleus sp. FACHB-SPT15 TaxID=2692830 RepID=UPI00177F8045|nr:hypothetical protein [Microcoleus sp. FACHB-SPT15]MBD1808385.1 hypothetical protein [Microcoleus sp. FACHB-SPT15]
MTNQPLDQMEDLQRFFEFCRTVEGLFCDFEDVENGNKLLTSLLKSEAEPYFTVIGIQKSHSLMCFWKYNDSVSLQEQPIVWLDSEGTPNAVFASNFRDFLSLLPYDTGAIYDWIASWERYLDNPSSQQTPIERFTNERIEMYIEMSREDNPFRDQFINWLREEINIEPATQPVALVGEAIQSFPRLSQWLTDRQLN